LRTPLFRKITLNKQNRARSTVELRITSLAITQLLRDSLKVMSDLRRRASTFSWSSVHWKFKGRACLCPTYGSAGAGGDEAKRAFDAMMGMKKIDVAAIDAARRR